jgi:hypothetical protein
MSNPSQKSALARRRPRAGARGAAMVEGLAAIPFFMIIFASAVYIHDIYNNKISTLAETRRNTWANAMGPCANNNSQTVEILGFSLTIPAPNNSNLAAGQLAPGGQLCDKKVDESSVLADESVTKSQYMGGGDTAVQSRYRVICNEQPAPADFKKGIDFLWNKYGKPQTPLPLGAPVAPVAP